MKKNQIIKKLPELDSRLTEAWAERLHISPLVTSILMHRGLSSCEAMQEFLFGAQIKFYDPFLMKGMEEAVTRIEQAVQKHEKITVYGDYDVDGITASSLLYLLLTELGAQVDVYIPKRADEGYGLNVEAMNNLYAQGTKLLVTVDCGISGIAEVAGAPEGMDVIITDHHMAPEELPPALAIVNPHQKGCQYPFKDLAGVGVSFKVCQALYQRMTGSSQLWQKHLELVAMGTVADIVPLVGENRELVRLGLQAFSRTKNRGLLALIKVAGLAGKPITSESIGFVLAPRLNAVGRLEHALQAVQLLTTPKQAEAEKIASFLHSENALRQEISRQIFIEAEAMLAQQDTIEYAIVLSNPKWHAGVIGIVASRLVDKYNLPAILITSDGENAKGSCRSIKPLNLYEAIAACKDELIQFGGHKQAAGITLRLEQIEGFKAAFKAQVQKMLSPEDFIPVVEPDCFVPVDEEITLETIDDLSRLEPYGAENPAPLFAFEDATLERFYSMGKEKTHMKYFLRHGTTSYRGVAWNEAANITSYYEQEKCSVVFVPKRNSYGDSETVDLHLVALEAKRKLVDWRHNLEDKEQKLRSVLQHGEKTVIYCQENNLKTVTSVKKNVIISDYSCTNFGTKVDDTVHNVVFYDLPTEDVFAGPELFKNKSCCLYLLYNTADVQARLQSSEYSCPTKEVLTRLYRQLLNVLQTGEKLTKEELATRVPAELQAALPATLKIFVELGFLAEHSGAYSFCSKERNELTNSPTFCQLEQKRLQEVKILKSLMERTGAEIASRW